MFGKIKDYLDRTRRLHQLKKKTGFYWYDLLRFTYKLQVIHPVVGWIIKNFSLALLNTYLRLWKRLPKMNWFTSWFLFPSMASFGLKIASKKIEPLMAERKKFFDFPKKEQHLSEMREVGFSDISQEIGLTEEDNRSVLKYFGGLKALNSQVPETSDCVPRFPDSSFNYWCYTFDQTLENPTIQKVLTHPFLKKTVRDYFRNEKEGEVGLYSANTMYTSPAKELHPVTAYHRDCDSFAFLVLFIYWTPTSKENGSTRFLKGSHLSHEPLEKYEVSYIEGGSGSAFLVDTFGIHSGPIKITTPRLVTWLRFAPMPTPVYILGEDYTYDSFLKKYRY